MGYQDLTEEERARVRAQFYAEDTTRERRIELLRLMQTSADEMQLGTRCPRCKHYPFYVPHNEALLEGHVYSQAGMDELPISRYCEFCFDLVTAESEEEEWGEAPEDVLLCTFQDETGHCVLSYGHDEDHLINPRKPEAVNPSRLCGAPTDWPGRPCALFGGHPGQHYPAGEEEPDAEAEGEESHL